MNGPLLNPPDPLGTLEILVPLLAPALGALASWLILGRRRFLKHGLIWGLALWGMALPLWVGFAGLMPHWGRDPLRSFPWHAAVAALVVALAGMGAILLLGRWLLGEGRTRLLLGLSTGLWVLLLAVLGLASRVDLATGLEWKELPLASVAVEPEVQVWFLDEGALMTWTPEGGRRQLLGGVSVDADARLVARRGAQGWDLGWVSRMGEGRLLEGFLPLEQEVPHPVATPWVKPFPGHGGKAMPPAQVQLREGGVEEAAHLGVQGQTSWSVQLGNWPRQGLTVQAPEQVNAWQLALDSPLWSAAPRCGSLLPGDKLLFQLGNHLYLTELSNRNAVSLGRGQGPLGVVLTVR